MLPSIMRIPLTAFALLLMLVLSSCGMSRVDQCKALMSEKTPKTSEKPNAEELLAAHKTALEGYKKLWLNDQDLKQFRDKQVNLLEQQISLSKESIELEKKPKNAERLQQAISQSQKQMEISDQVMALIKESENLCPSTGEQK
jgi:hypothetical protein